jgi:DNA-binding NtrC family response regulator
MCESAFHKAENGTVFLDDVDKLPPETQVRLLHLLQYKGIESIRGGKSTRMETRIIVASERNLALDAQAGNFRDDLYFRLNILSINLPPLRQRKQDIIAIAEYFIERLAASEGLISKILSKEAKHYLMGQYWSGNVRELENLIHRALVISDEDMIDDTVLQRIREASLSSQFVERRAIPPLHINIRHPDGTFKTMSEIEMETMQTTLRHFESNITRASDALGMAKSTFYRKIKDVLNQ